MEKFILLICTLAILSGCSEKEEGTVILTQKVSLPASQHDAINRSYSHLVDMQDDITRKYHIGSYTQKYILKNTQRLGNATPTFNMLFDVDGADINLNYHLFLANAQSHDNKSAILGLLAHELAHAQHYTLFSSLELIQLGIRYESYEIYLADSHWAEWVRSYERFTDLQAIAYGYSDALIHQKNKTLNYIKGKNSKDQNYEFSAYLTEQEIKKLSENPELFQNELEKVIKTLEWSVFKEIARMFPEKYSYK